MLRARPRVRSSISCIHDGAPAGLSRCHVSLARVSPSASIEAPSSMAASSGGQSKLRAVQTAATDFVNYVYTSPAFSSATVSASGGRVTPSSVSWNVPQWWPSACSARSERMTLTASSGFMWLSLMNQRGS